MSVNRVIRLAGPIDVRVLPPPGPDLLALVVERAADVAVLVVFLAVAGIISHLIDGLARRSQQAARACAEAQVLARLAGEWRVGFGGYLGDELRNITFAGEQDAAERVLAAFQQYQRDDRKIRELNAQGKLKEAVTFNTGLNPGQSNADFGVLSAALEDNQAINQRAFEAAVATADGDLDATSAALGAAALAAVLALTALGVRPRLREFA
ncbi:hypothetical protein ATKI12_4286 [Kitasatospora sp. Ki12]